MRRSTRASWRGLSIGLNKVCLSHPVSRLFSFPFFSTTPSLFLSIFRGNSVFCRFPQFCLRFCPRLRPRPALRLRETREFPEWSTNSLPKHPLFSLSGNFRKRKVLGTLCFPFCFPENLVELKLSNWQAVVARAKSGSEAARRRALMEKEGGGVRARGLGGGRRGGRGGERPGRRGVQVACGVGAGPGWREPDGFAFLLSLSVSRYAHYAQKVNSPGNYLDLRLTSALLPRRRPPSPAPFPAPSRPPRAALTCASAASAPGQHSHGLRREQGDGGLSGAHPHAPAAQIGGIAAAPRCLKKPSQPRPYLNAAQRRMLLPVLPLHKLLLPARRSSAMLSPRLA